MTSDLATDTDLATLAAESGFRRSHFLRVFRAAIALFATPVVDKATGGTGAGNIAK